MITVRAMPEGFLSDHLVRGLEPGTIVRLAAPAGEFTLPTRRRTSCSSWSRAAASHR